MLIPIYWGTQEKLKKDLMIGVDWCPNCQKFTESYIGRRVKVKHFEYIPLATDVLEHYLLCGTCHYGASITKNHYEEISHMFQPFSKRRDQLKCFQKATTMVANMEPTDFSVNTLMNTLSAEFPVCATPQLDCEYRRRFMKLLLVHGRGGSPAALMQPQQPQQPPAPQAPQTPQVPNIPQQKMSVKMDSI